VSARLAVATDRATRPKRLRHHQRETFFPERAVRPDPIGDDNLVAANDDIVTRFVAQAVLRSGTRLPDLTTRFSRAGCTL